MNSPSTIKYLAIPCDWRNQHASLSDLLQLHMMRLLPHTKDQLEGVEHNQVLVFTQTIKEAEEIGLALHRTATNLSDNHSFKPAVLHGQMSQK